MRCATDEEVSNSRMRLVRLTYQITPGHELTKKDGLEHARVVEVTRECVNIVAHMYREFLEGKPRAIAGARNTYRGHQVARRRHRKPGTTQHDQIACFDACKESGECGWIEDRHANAE